MPKTKVPPQPRLRLKLAHDLKEARVAGRRVREWISSHGVADLKTRDCELAVVESCNNAIQHSSRAGRSQPIYVEAQWQADCIEFQVIDSSAPWEFPNDPSLPPAENETDAMKRIGAAEIRARTETNRPAAGFFVFRVIRPRRIRKSPSAFWRAGA